MQTEKKAIQAAQTYLNREIERNLTLADSLPLYSAEYWAAVDAADNLRITEQNLHTRTNRFATFIR